ncbi:hypothetical protein AB0Q97_44360, partial [Streptomyces sp. NPDC088135]
PGALRIRPPAAQPALRPRPPADPARRVRVPAPGPLGDWSRAARHARRAARLQDPHFTRNLALYRTELTWDLARAGRVAEAAAAGHQVLDLLGRVRSTRIRAMLAEAVAVLVPQRCVTEVRDFLERHTEATEPAAS